MIPYRREIDGLRAIAVLSVIFFHARFTFFSGGYLGVDIFFVISGYLITSIIINELSQGSFSLIRFYERRIRRILPALFVMLLCCVPLAWAYMPHFQLAEFSRSLIAATLFAANFYYWQERDYFAATLEDRPLLHTWSLAVEEQYYVIFPLLLMILWHFRKRVVFLGIITLATISLLLSEWAWRNAPDFNFYLLPTRAFELLAGSICALILQNKTSYHHNGLSIFGGLLIIFSVICFDESIPFPSIYALIPVVGTALIILYGSAATFPAKVLSLRPLVAIGLVSYSLYLWHMPIFEFSEIIFYKKFTAVEKFALFPLVGIIAYMSWRWIEQPFRNRSSAYNVSGRSLLVFCLAMGTLLTGTGLIGRYFAEPLTAPSYTKALVDYEPEMYRSWDIYWRAPELQETLSGFSSDVQTKKVLILGDSHAKDLFNALYSNRDHFKNIEFRRALFAPQCHKRWQVFERCWQSFKADPYFTLVQQADYVILSFRWGWTVKRNVLLQLPQIVAALQAEGANVIISSNTVEFYPWVPRILRKLYDDTLLKTPLDKDKLDRLLYPYMDKEILQANEKLELFSAQHDIPYLEKRDFLCNDNMLSCESVTPAGEAIYFDYGHWTVEGATYLGKKIASLGWLKLDNETKPNQ